jgi:hypothetical protein
MEDRLIVTLIDSEGSLRFFGRLRRPQNDSEDY